MALEKEEWSEERGTKADHAVYVRKFLVSKGPMLAEYFAIDINAKVCYSGGASILSVLQECLKCELETHFHISYIPRGS
jgi:hypothetical protein